MILLVISRNLKSIVFIYVDIENFSNSEFSFHIMWCFTLSHSKFGLHDLVIRVKFDSWFLFVIKFETRHSTLLSCEKSSGHFLTIDALSCGKCWVKSFLGGYIFNLLLAEKGIRSHACIAYVSLSESRLCRAAAILAMAKLKDLRIGIWWHCGNVLTLCASLGQLCVKPTHVKSSYFFMSFSEHQTFLLSKLFEACFYLLTIFIDLFLDFDLFLYNLLILLQNWDSVFSKQRLNRL